MMLNAAVYGCALPLRRIPTSNLRSPSNFKVSAISFPAFLPQEVEKIEDPFARKLATRIERLPVQLGFSDSCIMSSCVKPIKQLDTHPLVLLHGFDSSCLEWRYTLPLLEQAGFETWAIDILGWGFSDLEKLPLCNVASKRDHFYQFWKSHIRRPMLLVGPSLGAAVAIDFAVNHPEAVEKLILIDASVYVEGTGVLPRSVAYAGVWLLKSLPLRFYATILAFNGLPFSKCLDWTRIGRLHCLLPWWEDATVDFMNSGGYKVSSQIDQVAVALSPPSTAVLLWNPHYKQFQVKQKTLIIWGAEDQIIDNKLAVVWTISLTAFLERLHCELPDAIIRQIPECGHIPHVEKPDDVAKLIADFVQQTPHTGQKVQTEAVASV